MNKKLFTLLLALVAIATTAQAQNTNGHEYVDLGLPSGTLWATCNVGASKPEEYGNHFAWGETSPKEDYTWDTYQWYDNGYTKYNGSDGKTELDLEDDAANANWGGDWQMPSLDQMKELVNQCTWEWETLNGAYGRRITGPNGNSIFLPAAGWRSGTSLNDAGTGGGYWSRMRSTIYSNGAYHMQLGTNEEDWDYYSGRRSDGQVVRAVVMKKQNTTLLLNAENFPDANFRAALAKILGINEGDEITEAKIAATTTLDVSKSRNTPAEEKIADLTGIEHFTALTWLDCGGNQLTSLDVSNNTALTDLYCYNNQLTALDVSGCTSLIRLSFYDNQLTALDVSNNTALIWLSCFSNQLTALDVSNNTALTNLYCYDNQIKGAAMDALVASLPTVSKGSFYVIDTKDENERNICTKAQVAVAKGKGWTVYDINGISSREYEGSDDATAKLLLNAENFPDANFRAALASILGISEGDEITAEKIAATTTLNVSRKQIANLTGIEHFTALKDLECGSNPLTSLDVSKNTALTSLLCGSNQLTSLDVSKNTALTWLDCDHNGLTSLDVSKNTALTTLYCEWNYLTSLDVSKNTALERLICYHNRLTSLNVSKNTALQNLRCDENQLTSLDVSGCTALKDLDCYQNGLTSLDVSGCTALTNLSCGNNQLTSLDVSGCTALTKLYCYGNQLTSLDVSKNTALTGLDCDSNQLTSLDVSKNTALTTLYCHSNQIKGKEMDALVASLPTVESGKFYVINTKDENEGNVCTKSQVSVAKGKGWTVYDYFGGGTLVSTSPLVWEYPEYEGSDDATAKLLLNAENFPDANFRAALAEILGISEGDEITAEKIAATTSLNCDGYGKPDNEKIADLTGIEHFTALTYLNCWYNQLTSIDVSKNTALRKLYCPANQLTSLDVSNNTALTDLECDENQLTSLDVSKNTALTVLYCHYNQLTTLDVSQNTALTELRCYTNQLTALDVSQNTALEDLSCGYNQLTSLDVSKNTALRYLECDNNRLTSLDVSNNTALTELVCYSNQLTTLDVSKNTALTRLDCSCNQLTTLDVSKNTALTYLHCGYNQLTALDVSNNIALEQLLCYNNQLTALDVSNNTTLTGLHCSGNQLTALDVSKNTALKYLYCDGNQLTSLDVSKNTALKDLYCYSNQIKGAAMDALVASLPTVTSGNFYVIDTKDKNEGNVCTKPQVAVAKGKGWTVYDHFGGGTYDQETWSYVYPEYEGSDPVEEDIDPVDEDDNIDFGSDMDENDDLNGNVIGDIYYNINTGNGGYNATEGCIVVKKPTDDGTVNDLEGKDIFGEDFKSQFTGIVFKVPAGKGTIKVNAETTGNMLLKVKIGSNDPVEMELNGKLKVTFPYNVSETTYVYIYAGAANEAKGFGAPASGDAALKIYGIEFIRDNTPTEINAVDSGELTVDSWYTIDGKKLAGEPKEKGIYIRNGKKVVK